MILARSFYLNPDVVEVARQTIGKVLVSRTDGKLTSGLITETEAYAGVTDKASHAFNGRRTARTEIMYAIGGTAYIYLCYGVHSLFNIVTNEKEIPHAVLIRGIIPLEGTELMKERTGKSLVKPATGYGPGNVTKLLGLHYHRTGEDLVIRPGEINDAVWLEDRGYVFGEEEVTRGKRIGVDYAGEDATLPYRFTINFKKAEKKIAAFMAAIY